MDDPGAAGVPLNEDFSYTVNVHRNTMHLTFAAEGRPTVNYSINLANNVDAYGKAGIYTQCSTTNQPRIWYVACDGTGDWEKDKANGDFAQATFSRRSVGGSTAP